MLELKSIPGTEIFINEDKVFYNTNKTKLNITENKNGEVTLYLYGIRVTKPKEWFYWLAYFNLQLPEGYEQAITEFEFHKHNYPNIRYLPDKLVYLKNPVRFDSKNKTEYRMIPRYPNYFISQNGDVVNAKTGKWIEYSTLLSKYTRKTCKYYPSVTIVDQAKIRKSNSVSIHTCVAMVWVDNPDKENKVFVDHIDGNKCNFRYSNLRWATPRENSEYAVEQGLNTTAMPIISRKLDTQEVEFWPSVTAFTKATGRSRINPQQSKIHVGKVFNTPIDKYELKYATDKEEFKLDNTYKRTYDTFNITVYNKKRGATVNFTKLKDFQKYMAKYHNFTSYSKTPLKEYLKQVRTKFPHLDIEYYSSKPGYVALNRDTGEEYYADLRKDLSNYTGAAKSSIQKSITNDGRLVYNGWSFKINNGEEFPKPTQAANKQMKIWLLDEKDKKRVSFKSIRELAKYLKITRGVLKSYINTNKKLMDRFMIYNVLPS